MKIEGFGRKVEKVSCPVCKTYQTLRPDDQTDNLIDNDSAPKPFFSQVRLDEEICFYLNQTKEFLNEASIAEKGINRNAVKSCTANEILEYQRR